MGLAFGREPVRLAVLPWSSAHPSDPAMLLPRVVTGAGFTRGCMCYRACQKTHWPDHKALCRPENIGFPFLISVPESRLTYARLAQLLEGYARWGSGEGGCFCPRAELSPVPGQL